MILRGNIFFANIDIPSLLILGRSDDSFVAQCLRNV
jgi:hypothetical protein